MQLGGHFIRFGIDRPGDQLLGRIVLHAAHCGRHDAPEDEVDRPGHFAPAAEIRAECDQRGILGVFGGIGSVPAEFLHE